MPRSSAERAPTGATPSGIANDAGNSVDDAAAPSMPDSRLQKNESVPVRRISSTYPKAFEIDQESTIPDGPVLDTFKSLEAAVANGDVHAGYVAFRLVYRCHDRKLAEAAEDAVAAGLESDRSADLIARHEKLLRDCQGVGAAEIAKGFELLRSAAEKGDIEAELTYPAEGLDQWPNRSDMLRSPEALLRFRDDAMRFLHAAAGRGNESAMAMLAVAYSAGTMTRRDPVRAYAYIYARSRLMQPLSEVGERVVTSFARDLSADQLQAGQAQALLVLDRCCR